ncbi:xanthine dehydrogenase family protein molybdopterin-binding subunit [Polyangium aurulentum]|uniref:xanthine dehydrogenase family protein molybdopterin-binding subunit n=1 Tax=Polyangium aurulentum TaxID=2567896 RepID=UPI0010AE1A21|nr:xanthine dehydrogenase family protein molybdopterin-binding subunit [Polyangium aurulentum]UQA58699.1 xanthine dehydrogenase family protein molybdopterin-binding subunit [Polyangium aurulentum]
MPDTNAKFPAGVAVSGAKASDLGQVERPLPEGEPPPWPVNAELSVVGKRTPRLDGRAKVTGTATYTADVRLPGMLYGRIIRSPHPHARVKSIDTSAADTYPGVRATHVLEHLRGGATLRDPAKETPSRYPVVRYVGQPIAAVAAVTQAAADEAARLIKIEYETLPFVIDLEEAQKSDAPLVFPGPADQGASAGGGGGPSGVPQTGNVRGPARGGPLGPPRGDVKKGFDAAEVIVEATYRTQVQTHSPLESHGVVADWKPDQLTVYSSTQGTSTVRDELAEVFDVPKARIRVVTEFMGGGFGAKFGIGNFGVLAVHLSKKAGAPVRMMLDRKEEHLAVGNRPNSIQRLRIGAKKDGTLTAIHLVSHGTGGTGTGAGAGGPAKNMYPCPNILVEESDVFTHAGPAAAFRAPGHPQGCFALEQSIDELAEKLGMDPLALRDKIDYDEDQGGKNVDSEARKLERKIGAEKIGWSKRRPPGSDKGPIMRGIGVAQSIWYRIVDLDAACEVRVSRDGSVELLSAVQDIGTGIRTALAQVVAEELGLRPSDIVVRIGDTAHPVGPASGGSKTTGSITPAARTAAHQVRKKFVAALAPALGADPAALKLADGKVIIGGNGGKSLTFRAAAARLPTEQVSAMVNRAVDYGGFESGRGKGGLGVGGLGGVQFAAVAVDTETGIIKVERVVAVHDCGRPINPLGLESQINGGILQGISYALYENRVLDRGSGHMLNANFEQYKILGAREAPSIEIVLLEEYRGRSSTDAGGIGEPATIPTSAAVANAVYNAIGVRLRDLPMTPARVLEALARKEAK